MIIVFPQAMLVRGDCCTQGGMAIVVSRMAQYRDPGGCLPLMFLPRASNPGLPSGDCSVYCLAFIGAQGEWLQVKFYAFFLKNMPVSPVDSASF